jgi:hypothetical protein
VETPLSEAQPGRKRAPTPEELRRRLPHTFRRIITVHPRVTFGPTEPRDVIQARTRSDQYSQYRTLRGAETGQAVPVISDPINVVLSFELWHLFLPSVLQSGHQKSVCGRPAFWVVIVPLK